MDDHGNNPAVKPPVPQETDANAQELIRDWEFLFWGFLVFGLARLGWMYWYRPPNGAFHLGIACGFALCGVLGFLMRWVFNPGAKGH